MRSKVGCQDSANPNASKEESHQLPPSPSQPPKHQNSQHSSSIPSIDAYFRAHTHQLSHVCGVGPPFLLSYAMHRRCEAPLMPRLAEQAAAVQPLGQLLLAVHLTGSTGEIRPLPCRVLPRGGGASAVDRGERGHGLGAKMLHHDISYVARQRAKKRRRRHLLALRRRLHRRGIGEEGRGEAQAQRRGARSGSASHCGRTSVNGSSKVS